MARKLRELFVSGGYAAELLEPVEAPFDTISQPIQELAEGMGFLHAFSVGDDRDGVAILDHRPYPFGAIGLVGEEEAVWRQVRKQSLQRPCCHVPDRN